MKRLRTFVFVAAGLSAAASAHAADREPGIYRLTTTGKGHRVTRSTGGEVELGERASADFGEATIWSLSNHNDRFRVRLKHAGPLDTRKRLALYANGVCEVVSSYGKTEGEKGMTISTDIQGRQNASKLAAALKVKLQERKHPGHLLLVVWRPVEKTYKAGKPVSLELTIKNVGSTTIRFLDGGKQRGSRNNQFGFTAFSGYGKAIPDSGDPRNFGGTGAYRTLKPGDVFRKRVDITKWFKFEKPDSYRITGMFEFEIQEKDFHAGALWQEFATGRCIVRIVK